MIYEALPHVIYEKDTMVQRSWADPGEVGAKGAEAPPNFFQIHFLIDGSRHRNIHWGDFFG